MRMRLSLRRERARRAGQRWQKSTLALISGSLLFVGGPSPLSVALPAPVTGEGRARSVLDNALGLEKPVTYAETKIPLGELVAKVAADTGVALTAARDVADEPVAVVVTDFPARELLEQLAELLDYRWSRRGGIRGQGAGVGENPDRRSPTPDPRPLTPVFEIYQDLASKQREEALRQALRAGVEQRFQEELAICRELAGKSQEEMVRLWDEATRWKERLEKLPPAERRALERSPGFRQQDIRHEMARRLWSPIVRSLAGLLNRFSPEQWAALRAGRHLVFSSEPQPGKLPLPPDVLRVFRTSRPTLSPPGRPVEAQPEREEKARQREREKQERWDQAEHYDVIFRLLAFETCWWDPDWIQFMAFTQPFRGGQRLGPEREDANSTFFLSVWPEKTLPRMEEDPGRRARLEQDPVLSVAKPFQPDPRPYVDPLFPGVSRRSRLLPEHLPGLARDYGIHFIANSYWNAPSVTLPSVAGPRPLFEVLDDLTGPRYEGGGAPFVWDRRGSLIRIRDQRWFANRPREIPLRTVRRWVALFDRLGALPLDEWVAATTTLTGVQVDTLEFLLRDAIFPPQLDDLRALSGSLSMLRLYRRLSLIQRQALQAGRPLATRQLSAVQRPFILAQLKRAYRGRLPMPDFEHWSDGYLTLSRTPDIRIREQRGQNVTWRLASAPASRGVTPPDTVTRFPVTRLRFELHYGAQTPVAVGLIVAAGHVSPE